MTRFLSVIIPTWDEAELIGGAVRRAGRFGDEILVGD